MATIQSEKLNQSQVSNLFWVNSVLGLSLFLMSLLSSPLIAHLYNEPRLMPIMSVMSVVFLIGGVSVQHDALLRRQMQFKKISVIDVSSMAMGVIAGVMTAFFGLQYWALVISPITVITTKTILRWLILCWIPSKFSRNSGVKPLLSFGANVTGANFIGYFASNATPFAIGLVAGAQQLGFYNRANLINTLPSSQLLPPIISVLQPTIARISDEPSELKRTLLSLIGKLALASTLITTIMAIFADWIVFLLLGSSWSEAVPVFRLLAIYAFIQPLAGLIAMALVATGNPKAMLNSKIHSLAITVVALLIGSNWGWVGIVLSFSLSGIFFRLPVFLYYSSRFLPLTFWDLSKPILPPVVCGLITILLMIWIKNHIFFESLTLGLFVLVPTCVFIYGIIAMMIRPARFDILQLISNIPVLFNRESSTKI